jgi:Chemotaxis response regulator containing a CheY-like receiver domain and a methylesterase domain
MRNITLFLLDDNPTFCNEITHHIDNCDDISLSGIANNSKNGIAIVKEKLPDVIILELELNSEYGTGLTFLEELRKVNLSVTPYILVVTHNTSSLTHECARKLGADFVMIKHTTHLFPQSILDFLRLIKNSIHSENRSEHDQILTESSEQKANRINRIICAELDRIGINPKTIGYSYLNDAIYKTIKNNTKNLSSEIGKEYRKTASSVERAMQNAINRAWHSSDIDTLLKYYSAKINSDKGVPTLNEFIYYYAYKIKHTL